MKRSIAHWLVVSCLGLVLLLGAASVHGEESVHTYLPLMAGYRPFPPNPPLSGYKGLVYSNVDGDYDLYTVRVDGSAWTNITNNDIDEAQYVTAWSDDGRHLFYENSAGAWLYNFLNDTTVLLGPADYYQALFSPSGQYLLLLSREEEHTPTYALTLVDIVTGETTFYDTDAEASLEPVWSPTSNAFAFRTVALVDNEPQVTLWMVVPGAETPHHVAITLSGTDIAWSDNGQMLMFTEDTSTETEESGRAAYTTTDGTIQIIAEGYIGAAWLADQQVLLANDNQLFTANADGSAITLFTEDVSSAYFRGEISPDRRQIIFYSGMTTYYRTLTSEHSVPLDPSCPSHYKQCYEEHVWAPNNRAFVAQYYASGHISENGSIYNDVSVDPPTTAFLGFGSGEFMPLSSRHVWFYNMPPSLASIGSRNLIIDVESGESLAVPLPNGDNFIQAWRYLP